MSESRPLKFLDEIMNSVSRRSRWKKILHRQAVLYETTKMLQAKNSCSAGEAKAEHSPSAQK
jgi:hypothetical protein